MSLVRSGRTRVSALVVLALVLALPAAAQAADCPAQDSARTFAPWGDQAWYAPAPDGGFEDGASGWALSGGAAVQEGNEPFYVGGTGDHRSLSLPAGSSARTPAICIDVGHPTIRLFARNTGSSLASLEVSVRVRALLGLWLTVPVGVVHGDESWSPTAPVPVVANLLSLVRGGQSVYFQFRPSGGEWSIDDLYVDPYSKG
jgi:hypothetical protein